MPIQQQLSVELAPQKHRNYPIYIGHNLLDSDLISRHIQGNQALIVSNATIAVHYLAQLKTAIQRQLPELQLDYVALPEGEPNKTLASFNLIIDGLMQHRHNRTTTLIALGGGIVGDICGFAAATFQRGVNFIQVPTTLLAQVDSSVGGKTGVNHPTGKNMIGAFHQPQAVIIDSQTLSSLPAKEFNAGVAEIIKYGLISDASFFCWLEDNLELLTTDPQALAYAIQCSCAIKAKIVGSDERESGQRALLNFGHTFGHAIESITQYQYYLHGEAVAIGMLFAAEFSRLHSTAANQLDSSSVQRIRALLERANLPTEFAHPTSVEQFIEAMAVDKKSVNGKLRFITLNRIGEAMVTSEYDSTALIETLNHCLVQPSNG